MSTLTSNQMTTSTIELNPTIQCNDLKAFERRLMETILQQKPRERLWRIVLAISLTSTAISSYFWLQDSMNPSSNHDKHFQSKNSMISISDDSQTLVEHHELIHVEELTFIQSLAKHYFFTINCVILIALFVFGIHQRVIQTNIIVNRIREVLYDFALSCDDQGKLIVKQKYSRPLSTTSLMFSSNNSFNHSAFHLNSSPVTQVMPNSNIQRRP
ncbi:nuclear envelope phosphatase-regulatory subunit 1 [Dermatophagoides farinae]|uniref:Transmembrane protein 188 n=1 Tax=Dermatophagoides farinae TaxID=6954 RepID=A0A922I7E8_DERFA|nr:nuclear envelope phosphatase-regulatory subunit 1-like [Dermatophagoides farinae]KAH7639348.1 nuclear envelope phosphatase-regulatory subunit 1-like protein [Dermatophagoides farinae]KAH9522060.1 Nuclear envelope phosphatase-regulatory subunit 1 [Dermatophagoides farinae]